MMSESSTPQGHYYMDHALYKGKHKIWPFELRVINKSSNLICIAVYKESYNIPISLFKVEYISKKSILKSIRIPKANLTDSDIRFILTQLEEQFFNPSTLEIDPLGIIQSYNIKTYEKPLSAYELTEQECRQLELALGFNKGYSEVILYEILSPLVKYIAHSIGCPAEYTAAVISPSGNCKTTFCRKVGLWLKNNDSLEFDFGTSNHNTMYGNIDTYLFLNVVVNDPTTKGVFTDYKLKKRKEEFDKLVSYQITNFPCANVILTYEPSTESMGNFSTMDRILQIQIPSSAGEKLEHMKGTLSKLDSSIFGTIYLKFCLVLLDNEAAVRSFIKDFLLHIPHELKGNVSHRILRHCTFILMIEQLFKKYFRLNSSQCHEDALIASLNNIISTQERNDEFLRHNSSYLKALIKILNSIELVEFSQTPSSRSYAYHDEENLYVQPDILQAILLKEMSTVSKKLIGKTLYEAELLSKTRSEHKYTCIVKGLKENVGYYHISKLALSEMDDINL